MAGTTFVDTGWQVDATADVPQNPAGSAMVVGTGCPPQFAPAVVGLTPWPGALLRLAGSSGAPGPAAVLHVLGRTPANIDLAAAGLPGCHLYQDLLVLAVGSTDPRGDFTATWGHMPADSAFAGALLRLQSFALDAGFNAGGARASAGLVLTLGPGFPPGLGTYSWFDRRATSALPAAADLGSTRAPVVEMY